MLHSVSEEREGERGQTDRQMNRKTKTVTETIELESKDSRWRTHPLAAITFSSPMPQNNPTSLLLRRCAPIRLSTRADLIRSAGCKVVVAIR